MKQFRIERYQPTYPKKLIKGAILATTAAVALAGTAGCELRTGGVPMPEPTPEELVLDGEVGIDESEGLDDLLPGGEPMPEETPASQTRDNGPDLMGKIVVPEETENP